MQTSLIITSIAAPNAAMKDFAKGCTEHKIEFIVVGDAKSPKEFFIDGCRFVSLEEQLNLPFKLAKLLPKNHYSRKNIGYLLAKNKELIIETDDDNIPKENFWTERNLLKGNKTPVPVIKEKGWINVYSYFTNKFIWPRGLPLEKIQEVRFKNQKGKHTSDELIVAPIIQSLADMNPDVDAVYRLSFPLPIYFEPDKKIALAEGVWCPFNSQNTTWFKPAFPLLYLPSYCSFRMTDIWRSFIAQRIAWQCGWNILFESPTVFQERNEHDLLKDFADEIPGYHNNDRIIKSLEDLDLKTGVENIQENLLRCYKLMTDNGWIGQEEMNLVEVWCDEI